VTGDMTVPAWIRTPISVELYDSWPEARCAGIEVVDGRGVAKLGASKRHHRLARILANALDAAAVPFPVTADLGAV
jgi:hypothetical protein